MGEGVYVDEICRYLATIMYTYSWNGAYPSIWYITDRVRERQNDRITKAASINASKQAEKIGYVPRNKQVSLKESGLASAGTHAYIDISMWISILCR